MYKFLKYSCILFLLLEVFGCFVSRKLIFIAQGKDTLPSYSGTLLQIQNEDRIVYAYFTRNSSRLAVVFHGQHGTLQSMSYLGAKLSQMGFSVLLVEYPGYGKAKRYSSSESNIYSDADAAINFVQKNFSFSKQNTIAIGILSWNGGCCRNGSKKFSFQDDTFRALYIDSRCCFLSIHSHTSSNLDLGSI